MSHPDLAKKPSSSPETPPPYALRSSNVLGVPDRVDAIALRVLGLVFGYRRLLNPDEPCAQEPCPTCYAPHLEKLRAAIQLRQPVDFVLPAFPAKSPNPRKVLGSLPDMAEQVAINHLQSVCEQIAHVYAPGARIIICSDGRVFSDVVGVHDEEVTAYRRELEALIENIGGTSLETFTLEQVFHDSSYDEMRRKLAGQYAVPLEVVRERIRDHAEDRALFNGIHRFMFEDRMILHPEESRNQVRLGSKELAYQVIQRSNAWSRLVAMRFPQALRLSIHPQPSHSEKIGFHLLRTQDNWLTPWHGVLLDTGKELKLVKRQEAEDLQASLVWRKQRPSHFVAPKLLQSEGLQ